MAVTSPAIYQYHVGASPDLGDPASGYDKTTYAYFPSRKLKTITDAAGNQWSYTYDLSGNELTTTDPDSGKTTDTYDPANQPGAVLGVTQAVLYPLSFFSNIFVTPATLPGWLRAAVNVNPVTHLVTAVRGLMSGTVAGGQVTWILLACAVLTAVFAPLSLRLFRAR